jgi:hypothetical protein
MKPYQTLLKQNIQWKGRIRNKRKGHITKSKNKNPQSSGQIKGVGKFSHVPNPPCDKRHVKKGEGKYSKNNISPKKTLTNNNNSPQNKYS